MRSTSREVMAVRDREDPSVGITLQRSAASQDVALLQLAALVFVIGPDNFNVAVYDLEVWLSRSEEAQPRHQLLCSDAREAYTILRDRAATSRFYWTCGACEAPIYTIERRMRGTLKCAACRDGGVDFDFHYRHVGDDS